MEECRKPDLSVAVRPWEASVCVCSKTVVLVVVGAWCVYKGCGEKSVFPTLASGFGTEEAPLCLIRTCVCVCVLFRGVRV